MYNAASLPETAMRNKPCGLVKVDTEILSIRNDAATAVAPVMLPKA
jgi:hypothetical protein